MKKRHLLLAVVLCLLAALVLAACQPGATNQPEDSSSGDVVDGQQPGQPSLETVTVEAVVPRVQVSVGELATYDYTSLFRIQEGDAAVPVTGAMLSGAAGTPTLESFDVRCTYGGQSATATVSVGYASLVVDAEEELTLSIDEVAACDFAALFAIEADGVSIAVPAALVDVTAVKAAVGVYPVSLTYKGQTAVVTVRVYRPVLVEVRAGAERISLKTDEVASYDFAKVFLVTEDGKRVAWDKVQVDATEVQAAEGEYTVRCSYADHNAQYVVAVVDPRFQVSVAKDSVRLTTKEVASYDFAALFSVLREGKAVSVDPRWVVSDVEAQKGTYTYTVSVFGASASVVVNVQPYYALELVANYAAPTLALSRLDTYDYTRLFSVFVEGQAVPVTSDMLRYDYRGLSVGDSFDVTLSYQTEEESQSRTLSVAIVDEDSLVVHARDVQIFPNAPHLDFVDLFSIEQGGRPIAVQPQMIEGAVDYGTEGDYPITLTYMDVQAVATVTVRRGVVFDYPHGQVIVIQRGTDPSTYAFEEDFAVRVNGVRFDNIRPLIDIDDVDFSTEGDYEVTLTVPYNSKPKTGLSGKVTFDYYQATVVYRVLTNRYAATVRQDVVRLPVGTVAYDPLANLSVSVNDRWQTLTTNRDYVNAITTYCEVVQGVDFASVAEQQISVDVYVQGLDKDPVRLVYVLVIDSAVRLAATNATVYSGDTVHRRDLFAIQVDGEPVDVEESMIEGAMDLFCPGVYTLTLRYEGKSAVATVTVLDNNVLGTYHTVQTTIGAAATVTAVGSWEEDEWEVYDDDYYEDEDVPPVSVLDDLVIGRDAITMGERTLTTEAGVDMTSMVVVIGSERHLLTYRNGIVTLDPENRYKLAYHATKRPLMYFNSKLWRIVDAFTINSSSSGHVLTATYSGVYSIDCAQLEDKDGNRIWFVQKTLLEERSGSDYIYVNSWGEATFAGDFDKTEGASGTLVFEGENYAYVVTSGVGLIVKASDSKQWAGRTFAGTVDGKSATLSTDNYEHYTLRIGGETVIDKLILNSYVYGAADYAGGTLTLHHAADRNENATYSYRFELDLETGTFAYVQRDDLFGRYAVGSSIFFLDGYGSGYFSADTTKYYSTEIAYTATGSDVEIRFLNTTSGFAYGKRLVSYVHAFGNVLTVCEADYAPFVGTVWENTAVVDGVLLRVNKFTVGKAAAATAQAAFLAGVDVVSPSGAVVDVADKANYFDFSKVNWNLAGFYLVEAKVNYAGEEVRYPYAVQVLEPLYEGSDVAVSFGAGVLTGSNGLFFDKYGQVLLSSGDNSYQGVYHLTDAGFVGKINTASSGLSLVGERLPGEAVVYKVRGTGAFSFVDYYTTAHTAVAAVEGACLRHIGDLYVFAVSTGGLGEIVRPTLLAGASLDEAGAIFDVGGKVYKLLSWGDTAYGLAIADVYRGAYALEGADDLVLDGFGYATLGDTKGRYRMNGRMVIFTAGGQSTVYRINPDTHQYVVSDIRLDESLVAGKTYAARYTITGASAADTYSAIATLEFAAGGVVNVYCTSSAYEQDTGRNFEAVFAARGGSVGTYSVSGTQITVRVEGYTFVLDVVSLATLNQLSCTTTNVLSSASGYFAPNTVFGLQ